MSNFLPEEERIEIKEEKVEVDEEEEEVQGMGDEEV